MDSPRQNSSRVSGPISFRRFQNRRSNSSLTNSITKTDQINKLRLKSLNSNNLNTKGQKSKQASEPIHYSKKLPINFITTKDWPRYINFANDIISNGSKKPRNRINRLLYAFLKLYHEYAYVCDKVLNGDNDQNLENDEQNVTNNLDDNMMNNNLDDNMMNSNLDDNMMNSNLGNEHSEIKQICSINIDDSVSLSNYNKFNDGLSNMSIDKNNHVVKQWFYNKFNRFKSCRLLVTKPYDKLNPCEEESIEIFSKRKTKKVIDHVINFTAVGSNGRPKIKSLQVPIALELLLPKTQIKIQRIMNVCDYVYDPLEIAAELRYFNYDVDACILHFQKTKQFRDLIGEFLPKDDEMEDMLETPQMIDEMKYFLDKISCDKFSDNINNDIQLVFQQKTSSSNSLCLLDDENYISNKSIRDKIIELCESVERVKATKEKAKELILKIQNRYKKQMSEFSKILIQTVESFQELMMTEEQRNRVMHLVKQNDELKSKLKEEEKNRKNIYNMMQDQLGNVRVYCRCRAMDKVQSVLDIKANDTIALQTGFCEEFKFDKVFEPFRTQAAIYAEFQPLVLSFIDGFNVCFITYGGEASGKTFTLLGPTITNPPLNNEDLDKYDGIMKRALREVLNEQAARRRDWNFNLSASVIEIYNDTFTDLLSGNSNIHLPIDQGLDRMQESLNSVFLRHDSDIETLTNVCKLNRKVGRTALNPQSSRSHLIVLIHLVGRSKIHGETMSSFLAMCDLAGFEDILKAETHNNIVLSKEAGYINKSLTAFNRVFASLKKQDPSTVSYRDTKLTYLLKPFLINQGRCVLIVTVRTDKSSSSSTQSTLRFGRETRSVTLGKARRQVNLDKIIC